MIGQNISLNYLIPLALELLQKRPLAKGDFYKGDLLIGVVKVDSNFWIQEPVLYVETVEIVRKILLMSRKKKQKFFIDNEFERSLVIFLKSYEQK